MNDFDTLQKLIKNVGDLGKIIVVKCFEWLPKVQKIAQSGHTACRPLMLRVIFHFTTTAAAAAKNKILHHIVF